MMEQSVHNVKKKFIREVHMSGKPQFDEATVVAAAMDVFWRHGFAASSINQLTAATGLSRSSLYQRFADKDGLFQEVLSTYADRVLRRMEAIRADTKRTQLEALLREFIPNEASSSRPAGCLLARSCAEMADLPAPSQAVVREGLTRQRTVIVRILCEAADRGELPRKANIEGLAWYYLGTLQAIMNLPQAGATAIQLRCVVDLAMMAWPVIQQPLQRPKGLRKQGPET
jgi:TetR/AcrR family transcriptional regulator, copper-responsive repressor